MNATDVPTSEPRDSAERMIFVLIRCALACIFITIAAGALSILYYVAPIGSFLNRIGISFQHLRPLHTTFASAWIFLGGLVGVHHFMFRECGLPTPADRKRFRFQMICWGVSGAGIVLTLLLGISSGREYLGFHPIFSVGIVAGWVAFSISFWRRVAPGFFHRPVYVYLWGVGVLYFLYTFIEGHAYLIPSIRNQPVVDLQIQWKHCGTVVASFNMLVYGTLMYLGELVTGDKTYARSQKGFWFLGISILNSFTNYAHHTYHLPQAHLIKWVAFAVSMIEIIFLVSMFYDLRRMMMKRNPTDRLTPTMRYLELGKAWSFVLLILALTISVPPINSLIHGTRVVMGHAMGSEIGIDSFILFAFFAFVVQQAYPRCWPTQAWLARRQAFQLIGRLNISLAALFAWLLIDGTVVGWTRAKGLQPPLWFQQISPAMFIALGIVHGLCLIQTAMGWLPFLRRATDRRELERDVPPPRPLVSPQLPSKTTSP